MSTACVMISDITGSTQLYEVENEAFALEQISLVLARLREIVEAAGGVCVKSQGDDVLAYFDQAEQGFQAAWVMINEKWHSALSVHVGLYMGEIMHKDGDIYGRPVNTAARLASLSKSGEILLGDDCFDHLEPATRLRLAMIGELQLKGKKEATRVYSCSVQDLSEQTVIFTKQQDDRTSRTESAEFSYEGQSWQISEGETLTIGRSTDCDIVMNHAWVSRKHGALSVRRWQLEYTDHSSTGSVLQTADGNEFTVHRRATLLNGSGLIFVGSGARADTSNAVSFDTHDMVIKFASK